MNRNGQARTAQPGTAAAQLPRRNSRRGTILIVVMWITMGLVAVALYFAHSMRLAYRSSGNAAAGLEAEQAIDGVRRYLCFILENESEPGRMPDLEAGEYVAEAAAVGEAAFWLIGRDPDGDGGAAQPYFSLIDEASKLNVNVATQEMLEALPNMTPEIAAAIVDWRDADSELSPGGAESQNYMLLEEPYEAKNADFESVDELRLVLGVDLEMLYGEDVNRNGALDPNENDGDATWPPDNQDGRLDCGLAEYLTVFTRQPATRADGTARVNLQAADARQQLADLLDEALGPERSGEIIERVRTSLEGIESPLEFYIESGMSAEEFALVEDALTVGSGSRVGLINPATAPAEVLACLPSMDEPLARQMTAARRGKDAQALASVAWVAEAIEREAAIMIGPYLTAQSYQFSADVAAVGREGRGLRRCRIVLDTEDGARVVYQRDMSRFGWPLGADVREELKAHEN
jgi:type II secretory pathway component PulK